MNFKTQVLKKIPIFSKLDESVLVEITSITKVQTYRKNRVIFNQGDTGNVLFFLVTGMVKIFLTDKDGKESILKIVYENDFFGEMSLLDGNFRSATIVALEDSKALLIYRDDLFNLFQRYPMVAYNMMVFLSRRLRRTNAKIATLGFLNAYGKVAQVLLDFIANRVRQEGGHNIIDLPVSRQEMAKMAGVSRETFSRILNKFVLLGCLKLKGKKIVVIDQEILKDKAII